MTNIITDKDKIIQYLKFKGISKNKFYSETGLSVGFLDSGNSLGVDKLRLILDKYHDLNTDWFLFDKGDIIVSKKNLHQDNIALKTEDKTGLPLVSIHAVAGFGNANFAISDRDVKDYYIIPKFKYLKVDFMIEVAGSSMYPKYSSGDIIACTIIRESKFIQWNKCHVVATKEQGILVKRLKKGDGPDSILAISDNKDYDPFLIPVNEITGIALVVGVIRLE